MSDNHPSVWVVILDYNTGPVLLDCVASFLGVRYPRLRLVVVDNASSDGMARQVSERFATVEVLRLQRNLGYCGGNNAGIDHALERGADYVLVVNPDTVVTNPDFVKALVDVAVEVSDAGIVGPLVDIYEQGNLQNTNCHFPFPVRKLRGVLAPRRRVAAQPRPTRLREVEVLNGVCVLLKREMMLEIGGYDPVIFMYGEDWDMTIRSRKHGWKSLQAPVNSIVHVQKKQGYDYLSMTNFLLKRNAAYVLIKHGYRFNALLVALGGATLSLARAVQASARRKDAARYWAFFWRLTRAYVATFRTKVEHPDFGPPTIDWTRI